MRHTWKVLAVTAVAAVATPTISADAAVTRTLVPIGSDYQTPTLELFAREAARQDADGDVHILVIPITFSLDAFTTTKTERKKNLTLADTRRGQVETACLTVTAGSGKTCTVELVPVLVREDALNPANLAFFARPVDGMYVLGGDQTVAMRVVQNTPLEAAMDAAHQAGAVFGGNSAGAAVQSRTMINGYVGDNGPVESLRQGAVDVWTDEGDADTERGLVFGFRDIVAEQHVFERGRTGRALNVAATTGKPVLGMDAATGAVVRDEAALTEVAGLTSGILIDPLTLGSTHAFGGPSGTLSVRDVVAHVLAPGGDGADLATLQPTFGGVTEPAPTGLAARTLPAVTTPAGSGALLLGGGGATPASVGGRFVELAGGAGARIVVITTGYAKSGTAQADAKAIAAALQPGVTSPVQWFVLDAKANQTAVVNALAGATGIWLSAPDKALVGGALQTGSRTVGAIDARWRAGVTVMADDAAAAALGGTYAAVGNPADAEGESYLQLLDGALTYATGASWYGGIDVQPRLLPDYNWPQLLQVASRGAGRVAVGVDVGTALEVRDGSATVRGTSAVVAVDGRSAIVRTGGNGSLSAHWLVIDSFVAGESVAS